MDSDISKSKLGPSESEETGRCFFLIIRCWLLCLYVSKRDVQNIAKDLINNQTFYIPNSVQGSQLGYL